MRILLVEDDELLGDGLQAGLAQQGFAPDWVKDGVAAGLAAGASHYSAIVLDLGLPRLSGMALLQRLRAAGNKVPVLILTARDAVEDRIKGLDAGADDYLVKPFDLHELCARLRALIRRSSGTAEPLLRLSGIELDPAARQVRFRGRPLELSTREFALLHELMLNTGRRAVARAVERALYAWGDEIESNAIDVHIHHLRRKLSAELIQTVRGVGYVMTRDHE